VRSCAGSEILISRGDRAASLVPVRINLGDRNDVTIARKSDRYVQFHWSGSQRWLTRATLAGLIEWMTWHHVATGALAREALVIRIGRTVGRAPCWQFEGWT
jgi:hypothetical protein